MWTKPPAGARPDRTHLHARGLVHAWLFNERDGQQAVDCVSGVKVYFRNGTPQWAGSPGVYLNGSSDLGNFDRTPFNRASATGPYTLVAGLRQTGSQGSYQTVWAAGGAGFYIVGGLPMLYPVAPAAVPLLVGVPAVVSYSTFGDEVVNSSYYMVNGGFAGVANYNALDANLPIGGHGGEYFIGDLSFLYVYDRYVAPGTMVTLHNEPFAMFLSLTRRVGTLVASSIPPASTFVPYPHPRGLYGGAHPLDGGIS